MTVPVPRAREGAAPRVYESAIVAKGAIVESDVVVGAFTFVAEGARVGAGTRIQGHTSIWDGVVLGEDVFVGPAATFTNVKRPRAAFPRAKSKDRPRWDETIVGNGATIGARAVLVAPLRVGACAMIGAGAVVIREVPAHAIVVGSPARIVGWSCTCGERLARGAVVPLNATCDACGRSFARAENAAELCEVGAR